MRARPRSLSPSLLAALLLLGGGIPAQDAAALARDANAGLRAAERSMFAGKLEQAQQELAAATELLGKLAALDPQNSRLGSLRSKEEKLRRDLERRTGVKPASGRKVEPGRPPAKGEGLPAGATRMITQVDDGIARLRKHMADEDAKDPEARAETATQLLEAARDPFERLTRIYAKQIATDHGDLAACRERLAAAEQETATFCAKMAAAAAAAAPERPSAEQIAADAKEVEALADAHLEALSDIHGNSLVYGLKLEDAQKALTQLEAAEAEALPALQPVLTRVARTYGTSAMEVNNKLHGLGAPRDQQFGNKFERLVEGAQNVLKSRVASAEAVARNADTMLSSIDRITPELRVPRLKEWKEILQVGQQLDPNNAAVNTWLATIDARISEVGEQIERDIDAVTWAGHVDAFPGPGDAEDLAAKALDWFRSDRGWGGNPQRKVEILAVAVRGPWQVAERDVFARVIRWRLPIHVAVTDEKLRGKSVARVYELSIVALQGAPNDAPKAPPYDGCWVGANWMMRLDKLPQ